MISVRLALIMLMVLAASAVLETAATAQTTPGAIVVLDISSSMWGDFGAPKFSKWKAAREALKQAAARARPDARIGLMAYGLRRKSDCEDVELLAQAEAGAFAEATPDLEKLNPRGRGPIALALSEAVKVAAAQSAKTVILIYDGPDNCQKDVCAAASAIAKAHPGFAIHTIGLALDANAIKKTACIAQRTGGKAFDARDAATLGKALDSAFELARLIPNALDAAPPPKPVSPEQAAASGPPRVRLTAHLGSTEAPISTPVAWTLRGADGKLVREATVAEFVENLEPGAYDVEAKTGFVTGATRIMVAPKGLTAGKIELDAGAIRVAVKDSDPPARDIVLSVIAADREVRTAAALSGRQWVGRQANVELVAPPGRYKVAASRGLVRQEEEVTIKPGAVAAVDISMNTGRIDLSAAEREGGEPLDGVSFGVWVDDPAAPRGRREIARSFANRPAFTLASGTYHVTARLGAAEAREQIAIGAGAAIAKTLIIPIARLSLALNLKISPPPSAASMSYRISRLEGEKAEEIARGASQRAEFALAPGRYKIEALAGENATTTQTIDLAAGARKELSLGVEAGALALKLGGGKAHAIDSFWEVRDASDRLVWRTTKPEPHAFLAPGRYVVRYENRDRRLEAAFELAAGEQKQVELAAE